MSSGLLRQDQDQRQNGDRQHGGGERTTERQAAVIERLVEEISDSGSPRDLPDPGDPPPLQGLCVPTRRRVVDQSGFTPDSRNSPTALREGPNQASRKSRPVQ